MALPTIAVTPGSGATINTLQSGGQQTPANAHPFTLDTSVETAPGTPPTLVLGVQGHASGVPVPVTVGTALPPGTSLLGKIGIDQTTPGTTNLVAAGQQGTWTVTANLGTIAGVATATLQTTGNTSLASIDGKLPALVGGAIPVANQVTVGAGTVSTTPSVNIATDQSNIPVVSKLTAVSAGLTWSTITAAASTNAAFLKASAGNIGRIDLFNNADYTIYFKLYDKASAPTVGTDTPVFTIPIPSGSGYPATFERGRYFGTGIAYAITKNFAVSDATAVAAGDVTGQISWI